MRSPLSQPASVGKGEDMSIGVRGVGSAAAPGLKNFRANSVFRASASCSKILDDKKYSENFQGNSVFQGKRKLLKNPE